MFTKPLRPRPLASLCAALLLGLALTACQTANDGPGDGDGAPTTGTLQVNVSGVASGSVTVTGPAGYRRELTVTTTLTDLAPGAYVVSAAQVDEDGRLYGATVAGAPVTVAAGATATVTVTYVYLDPTTVGALRVDLAGLPEGVAGAVTVAGPGGFTHAVTAATTLADLVPGYYDITAADVVDGPATYAALVDEALTGPVRVLVLPEETTAVTVSYGRVAPEDGDTVIAPAVYARFRPTSGAPVRVTAPLFNATPLDVRGLAYENEVSYPRDFADHVEFDIDPGEGQAVTIQVTLDCKGFAADPTPILATLYDPDGGVRRSLTCASGTTNIALTNDGGTLRGYRFEIAPRLKTEPAYVAYELAIDAFCHQGCDYQPYAGAE